MDIRKYFQDYLLVIFLVNIHHGFCSFEDDYEDLPAFGRCPRIRSKLKNGRVRLRYKGRVAKFLCDSGYELAGKRSSTCVRGQWSNPTPVCVARGCNRVPSIANGRVTEMYRGALLVYDCNPGYTLNGDSSIHCDGRQWNTSPPICTVNPDVRPETKCDFESPTLCGWTHDPTHDFDWFRNQFATPSGHVGTGPSHDHTFGENKAGYYMYIEASSPRKTNDTARLFSPVYPSQESGGCFTFWYHMYGATTGGLRVYFKPESHVFGELSPKWEKFGDQGNQWLRGNISVPAVNENFQIVIEGIRGESYVGDSAIDDVQLSTIDCQAMENENDTISEITASNSCRGRCRATIVTEDSCECKESCVAASSCCSDYHILCSDGSEIIEQNTNEPEPGDYYGKTTSPVTETAALTTETTKEMQISTILLNIPSQSTSQSSVASIPSSVPVSSSTVTVTSKAFSSSPSTSLTPSTLRTTDATKTSTTDATVKTEPQTVALANTTRRTSTETPIKELSSLKPNTTVATSLMSTPHETVRFTLANSTKPNSSTKTISMTNTTSTLKTSPITEMSSLATTLMTTPLTTSTTTTQKSTTTTPASTTQSSTTTTPVSTTQSSTKTAPTSTTTTSTSTSTVPTTMSSTNIKPVTVTVTQSTTLTNLITTAALTSSVSQSSTASSTTTPRYNLRPRKTTSISTSTKTTYTSSPKTSPISSSTATSTFKTESSTLSSVMSPSRTRWRFDFKFTSTSTVSSTITSPSYRIPIYIQKTSKYPNSEPKPSTPSQPLSTTDSYEMVASKTESSKSSGGSSVIIGVVIFSVICIIGIAVFYIRRHRSKRLSKLDDDSEMRFLPDSDYMEYSDASTLDRILAK